MLEDNAKQLKTSLIIDSTKLFIYLIATAYIFYYLSTARPHVGMWQELLIIIPLFGVLRHSFFTIHTLVYKKQAGHKLIISVASFVVGVIISSIFANISSNISVDILARSYQPMINALHSNKITQCTQPDTEINAIDSIRPKVKNRGNPNTEYWATVYFSDNSFVVAITGDSFEKNSSTLYYESQSKKWVQFHNKIYNDRSIFEKLIENSIACKIKETGT